MPSFLLSGNEIILKKSTLKVKLGTKSNFRLYLVCWYMAILSFYFKFEKVIIVGVRRIYF